MLIMVNKLIIRYCCGKQCELLLNRFLIRDLHHKLDLLSFTSFFYNDDKIRPPPLFQPRVEKISTPQLVSQSPPKEKFRPPTSFWTIRTLTKDAQMVTGLANAVQFGKCSVMHMDKRSNTFSYEMVVGGSKVVRVSEEYRVLGVSMHKSTKPSGQCAEASRNAN